MAASLKAVLDDLLTQFAADPDLDIEAYGTNSRPSSSARPAPTSAPALPSRRARHHPSDRLGGEMKPYFDTNHIAGPLLLVVALAWGAMELSQFSRGLEARKGATKIGGGNLAGGSFGLPDCRERLSCISRRASSRLPRSIPAPSPSPPGWRSWWPGSCCAGGRSRRWASTSPSPSWSAPTSRWSQTARIACCATPATPGSCWFASGPA